ncbi:uncharacterized protein LOC133520341 [Cydia pomonella]|uniref:uncharacterized protein LOC133520341 n=1 Tax=Cydia pomonella TaxID=82600 RepID=UPI002ADDD210|nr:uncharacterized protein LOC133520341 [Cydia pomonella]
MFVSLFCFTILALARAESFCSDNVRWSHRLNIVNAYGVWHGVAFAQHTPDMTNKPLEVGCVTLYISDATGDYQFDWLDWSAKQRYNASNWWSLGSNPWGSPPGPWYQSRRRRDLFQQRRIRVLWDEDGETMEQTYDYSPEDPGLWTIEQWRPGERELRARGVDLWYPDDPPRHPEVVRLLKLTPDEMIINHCTELGDGGIFSLILRRFPVKVRRWERLEWQKFLMSYGLSNPYRYLSVCAACVPVTSLLCFFATTTLLRLL